MARRFDHSPPGMLLSEVRRVLRMGGLLAVCTYTPLAFSCYAGPDRPLGRELVRPYPQGTASPSTVASPLSNTAMLVGSLSSGPPGSRYCG